MGIKWRTANGFLAFSDVEAKKSKELEYTDS